MLQVFLVVEIKLCLMILEIRTTIEKEYCKIPAVKLQKLHERKIIFSHAIKTDIWKYSYYPVYK